MTLIQYIIIRSDLVKTLKWPLGAIITQACHAAVAVNEIYKDDEEVRNYLSKENIDHMHKCTLAIPDQASIEDLHKILEEKNIKHKLWVEQPENIPTCIAVKPYEKETVQDYFKSLKLMR